MRKIIIGIFLISYLLVSCDCGCDNYKYFISDDKGNVWGVNKYKIDGSCITFDLENSNGDITICGSYKIEKNENYKL